MIKNMSDVILFDIDNTLLDTSRLFNDYIKSALLEILVVNSDEFEKVSHHYFETLKKPTQFDPEAYLTTLADSFEANREQLLQVIENPDWYVQSIFPDAEPTLATLQNNYTLGIYSEGVTTWQQKKLALSGLHRYFDPQKIYITDDKLLDTFLSTVPESVIVDDRLPVIQALQTKTHLRPIWLNRQLGPEVGEIYCETIMSLSELPELLTQN